MPVSDKKEDAGVVLKVLKQNGKQYSVPWTVAVGDGDNFSRLKTLIETVDISQMNNCRSMSTSAMGGIGVLQISFPCVLLQASFDPLTVIRASELFSVQAVCLDATCSHALQFCAEEVWDLCSSSNHLVGNKLPVAQTVQEILQQQQLQCGMDGKEKEGEEVTEKENDDEGNGEGMYNMILPMATTPLLMSLYCERGRLYHNGINITGDVLALTSATGQWAKAFHDILLFLLPRHTCSLSSRGLKASALMDVALRCLVSYSYAIDYPGLAPCINMVEVLYTPIDANIGTETDTDTPIIVMKRDGMSGLTCPLGVAMLAAYLPNHPIACTSQVHAWNTLIVTIFSRLCEAISGQKNIRCNSSNTSLRDPSELETSYRLKVGELQTTLKRRLHLEWANSSREEKLAIIAENAGSILVCLQKIVTEFVNKLDTYNLPTLSRAMCMVKLAMAANNYGIQRLRDIFLKCEDTTNEAVRTLLSLLTAETSNTILPVCLSTTIESVTSLQLRELTVNDHTLMLAYIDAIVATKVSPKIVYKPVVNPSYPTFTASQNDSLHFEKSQIDWDVELPVANVCLIGNVNSGKSSIGGQLLSLLNIVPASALVKMQKMAQKLGRTENLQYAWVMDRLQEERSGGFTVMPKFHGFQTAVRRFSMVDNPGHTVSQPNHFSVKPSAQRIYHPPYYHYYL